MKIRFDKIILTFFIIMVMLSSTVFASELDKNPNYLFIGKCNSQLVYIDTNSITYDSEKKVANFVYITDEPSHNQYIVWNYTIYYLKNCFQIDSPFIFKYGTEQSIRASAVEYAPIKPNSFEEKIKNIITERINFY